MQLTEPDQLPHESYSAGWQTNGRADARRFPLYSADQLCST